MMDIQIEDFQISLQEYHSGCLVRVQSNPILHTMFCLNCWVTSQSKIISLLVLKILKGVLPYTYGNGGHLGHVTKNITNFCSPILRSLHMKFELYWPIGSKEDV